MPVAMESTLFGVAIKGDRSLRELKEKIDARNVGRYLKYDLLSPVNVPLTTQT